jgi:hypothetical protein
VVRSTLTNAVIKYKKVKGLYFEKQAQVEQLQNTLANQRLSQSRTSLDDSEYLTRFQRLDGAIKEVAFSIRKVFPPRLNLIYLSRYPPPISTLRLTQPRTGKSSRTGSPPSSTPRPSKRARRK